jgi:hypothetical protein
MIHNRTSQQKICQDATRMIHDHKNERISERSINKSSKHANITSGATLQIGKGPKWRPPSTIAHHFTVNHTH